MRVLLTGTDGYIGSLLAARMEREGYDVYGLDTGYYRDGWLFSAPEAMPTTVASTGRDLRTLVEEDFRNFDAVVHLAELSNDPLGENNPDITRDINFQGSLNMARAAKAAGVPRFVYASSCSVYGIASEEVVDEASAVNPQTAYAECKVRVENAVGELADASFSPVFLRNSTAYGASPRMRFDIVLNNLVGLAHTKGRIEMTSDGSPWRPIVHIDDICSAIICALEAPDDAVRGEIFNVGSDPENYTVKQIAEMVQQVYPDCDLVFGPPSADNRSYKVRFEKISTRLPGFRARWTAIDGVRQLHSIFSRIGLDRNTFEFRAFTRLRQLEYLIRTKQIDDRFYWTNTCSLYKHG